VSIIGQNSPKKGSKNGFFMVRVKIDFSGFLKWKMVIHMTKKKIESRVSENLLTMEVFENSFFS